MVPSTVQQLAILLVLVLPGAVYQAVGEVLRGPRPANAQAESRLLRAITASVLLDGAYALAAGPWLVELVTGTGGDPLSGLLERPREAGAAALLLLVAVPALAAWVELLVRRRRARARHRSAPTAWDHLFGGRGSCFVRVRTKDGGWVGGWYGHNSLTSAYPHGRDLFIEAQYAMDGDGRFGERMPDTGGVYVPGDSVEYLEIIEAPAVPRPSPATAPRPAPAEEETAHADA
ncbi:DUF6338 family protein [Allonocardiopsis opalescens]|uniref:Uncharacterized protein n=1 Tax=Allonocardiopsis opalescens TaxID=1144618 RepID=A0A2T0Q274_9ACTN|nr:DUF6338 family protein [Allonocardiopsis opalescens]PRX97778.1 hypothetical protein CLV72_105128 [Allonocardiopsis opalescens]